MKHAPHDLPGTDPRFHESRNYLSVMVHQGKEMIASNGSCKEAGCGYRAAWKSNAARDKGMFEHRMLKVREARAVYFNKLFSGDGDKIAEAFRDTGDCNSHDYKGWLMMVRDIMLANVGVELTELPDYNYRVAYDLGRTARETFEEVMEHAQAF